MKYICFRFDVDTHKCLRDGVPNLLNLAKKYKIKFTFFLNAGRSIDHWTFLKEKLRVKASHSEDTKSFSARKKLGINDYIYAALFNPRIVRSYPEIVRAILKGKHEIGLHGGRNHDSWHRNAHTWNEQRIRDEVQWGMEQIKNISADISILGFASPGWNGSTILNKVIKDLSFSYIADRHTDKPFQEVKNEAGIRYIPTNILGEPGGVGYLEYCRASGMSDNEILKDFKMKLKGRKKLAVMYDHPYYAGVQELPLLEEMIQLAHAQGYTFVTMQEISKL